MEGDVDIISAHEARKRAEQRIIRKFQEEVDEAIENGQDYVVLLSVPRFLGFLLRERGYRIEAGENKVTRVFW